MRYYQAGDLVEAKNKTFTETVDDAFLGVVISVEKQKQKWEYVTDEVEMVYLNVLWNNGRTQRCELWHDNGEEVYWLPIINR